MELDVSNLLELDEKEGLIKFNVAGYYRIFFTVSAYPSVNDVEFDPTKDIVSIGFKETNTDNVYLGVGQWVYNAEPVELSACGIIAVVDTAVTYELSNLGKYKIFLRNLTFGVFYIIELRLFSSCFWIHFCEIMSLLASGKLMKKNEAFSILSSSSVLIYFALVLILLGGSRISKVTLSGIFISLSSSRRIPLQKYHKFLQGLHFQQSAEGHLLPFLL